MRRKELEQDTAFALEVTDRCVYAVISMVTPNGEPYGVPVNIVREGKALYFHSALEGKKADALRQNPRVSVACVGYAHRPLHDFVTIYDSAILSGRVTELEDQKEKVHALRLLCERHTPEHMPAFGAELAKDLSHTAVWKIEIESVTGKSNRSVQKPE